MKKVLLIALSFIALSLLSIPFFLPENTSNEVFAEYQAEIEAINKKHGSKITLHNVPEGISKEDFLNQLEEMAISSSKVSEGIQKYKDLVHPLNSGR